MPADTDGDQTPVVLWLAGRYYVSFAVSFVDGSVLAGLIGVADMLAVPLALPLSWLPSVLVAFRGTLCCAEVIGNNALKLVVRLCNRFRLHLGFDPFAPDTLPTILS